MNKKIVGIILCTLMLAAIPVAAGTSSDTDTEKTGIFGKTYVRGFILGSRTEGIVTSFFALLVHYRTYSLFGETDSGVLVFQKVSFIGKFSGHLGRFYVMGTFRGTPS